jgi:iron complex outermembrane receptor protein
MSFSNSLFLALAVAAAGFAQEASRAQPADSAIVLKTEVIRAARPLTNRESAQVARIPLKNLENPQAYSVVPKELTRQQMAVDYNSAFKNIPGTTKAVQWMQGNTQFYSRGFETTTDVRNGLAINSISDVDPVNTERIEAIRGPAGALFGTGSGISYGGLFNRVTKTPHDRRQGEVTYTAGSWNLTRVTADINTPVNEEKTVLFRINLARHLEGSFMDQGFTNAWAIAPSLSYQASDRLKLSIDLESYHRLGTAIPQIMLNDGRSGSVEDLDIGYRRAFLDNSLVSEAWTTNAFAKAEYRISRRLSSETSVASTNSMNDLKSVYLGIFNDSQAVRYHDAQNWKVQTLQFQQNFRGEFEQGILRHQALLGFGASHHNYTWPYTVVSDTVNYAHPDADYYIGQDVYRARIAAAPMNMWMTSDNSYNAYASDAIRLGDFTALLGVRWDRFDNRGSGDGISPLGGNYIQDAFTPKVGLVYQPIPERVSLYTNYMSGYQNVDGRSFTGETFKPERAHQGEVGVKAQAPGGRLTATVSLYAIEVRDVVRADPAHPGFSVQDGTQQSRGYELDLSAYPIPGLSLVAGYASNRSKMTKADADVQGRRPASAGPEETANFWVAYEIPSGAAEGLGAGLGANYASEAYNANTSTQVFTVPEYLLWDATVFYDRPAYRIGFKVDNITNQKYWNPSYLQAGAPRRFLGEVAYRF